MEFPQCGINKVNQISMFLTLNTSFDSIRDYNLTLKLINCILLMQKTRVCTRTKCSMGYGQILTQLRGVHNLNYLVNTNRSCCSVFILLLLVTSELEVLLIERYGCHITKRAKQAPYKDMANEL